LSFQVGRGFEHQLPHLYSQVGVGVTVYVDVQREAVVLVVEVVGGGGGVEELVEVLDVIGGVWVGVDEVVEVLEIVGVELVVGGLEELVEGVGLDDVVGGVEGVVVGELEDVEVEEDVGGGVELELEEDEDPPLLQGWVDSRSLAT
jgi:hypothetical protein